MIPELIDIGAPYKVLPLGIHDATLEEIKTKFAYNDIRKQLFKGFLDCIKSLKFANCRVVYVDGSFVSDKDNPGDYDLCWDTHGTDTTKLDPVFFDFSDKRKNQKIKYKGESFPSSFKADGKNTFLDYFQIDKYTGNQKGIIKLI